MKLAELNALLKCCKRKIWQNNKSKNLKFLGSSKILLFSFQASPEQKCAYPWGITNLELAIDLVGQKLEPLEDSPC